MRNPVLQHRLDDNNNKVDFTVGLDDTRDCTLHRKPACCFRGSAAKSSPIVPNDCSAAASAARMKPSRMMMSVTVAPPQDANSSPSMPCDETRLQDILCPTRKASSPHRKHRIGQPRADLR